ncbi:hypothetical protein RJ639_005440 [Escallonia herrerae]|uniref:Eukaryotic initiation factor 4A n=1 Tax=Escallonia herrerae TaxID=1293975 RepID=A0AA88W281_9ASTE|nr:hypothetical protein RJ639_005440 [Escallonia herrerae]
MEAVESPSPPHSNFSQQRHFYLAVDRLKFRMETVVELLGMAGCRRSLPMVVCCGTRDELDAVCSAVSNLTCFSIATLYSDLDKSERALILDKFRQATTKWNQNASVRSGDEEETGKEEQKSKMIIVTDACLPLLASGESPISARILINYELPTKKVQEKEKALAAMETYMRRMTTCLAADGIVINMVVGGEVVTLKSIEDNSSLVIEEMPMHVSADAKWMKEHVIFGLSGSVHFRLGPHRDRQPVPMTEETDMKLMTRY